jgi:hypothetical protein
LWTRPHLQEVKACAESYAGGVKVNLDHGAGIKDIIGFVDNFRIVGDKLVADLNLLENADRRAYVLEIAEKLPDTFGISIAFSGPVREIDGKSFASCTELYSADLVQTPAANPTGLFSFQAVDKKSQPMDTASTNTALEDGEKEDPMKDILSRLAALETFAADYKKGMEEKGEEKEMAEDEDEKKDEMCNCASKSGISNLEAKLDQIISNFGAAPMKGSAAVEEKKEQPLDLKAAHRPPRLQRTRQPHRCNQVCDDCAPRRIHRPPRFQPTHFLKNHHGHTNRQLIPHFQLLRVRSPPTLSSP